MSVVSQQWRCTAGSLSNLRLVDDVPMELPLPVGPLKVLVNVHYVGLNFADMFACLGLYSATPAGEFVPGLEFSGVVEAVFGSATDEQLRSLPQGDGAKLSVGDRVLGVTRFGGYATRVVADACYVRKVPDHWTLAQAAAFPCQALTAWYGLVELANIRRGSVVLIHSAAGGTGLWALKICRHVGANVIATVSSASKAEALLALEKDYLSPATVIIRDACWSTESKQTAIARALEHLKCTAVNTVLDSLLGDWFRASHDALAPMGRHIVLGAGSMTPNSDAPNWIRLGWQYLWRPMLDPLSMISTNKSVMAFNLIWLYENTEDVGRLFHDLMNAAAEGMSAPHIGLCVPFADAVEALRTFQSGATVGKCLLRCPAAADVDSDAT